MKKIIFSCTNTSQINMAKKLEQNNFDVHFILSPNKVENDIEESLIESLDGRYSIVESKKELLQKIEELCNRGYNFIYPLFADSMVTDIATINDRFNLLGIQSASAEKIKNKSSYYKIWKNLGVPCPEIYDEIEYLQEIHQIAESINFPCIVKPSSGFCSLGVQIIENQQQLIDFFQDTNFQTHTFQEKHNSKFKSLQYLSLGGNYLIQQYIPGILVSVSGIVKNKEISIDFMYEIESDCYPYTAETGFVYPSKFDTVDFKNSIIKEIKKFFDDIELDNSPFMFDIIVDKNRFYFIDFAARTSAVSYRLFLHSGEKNYAVKLTNKLLFDETYTLDIKPTILRMIPLKNGTLKELHLPDSNLADQISYPKSKQIRMLRNDFAVDHNGTILVSGNTLEEAEIKFSKIIQSAVITYQT